MKLVFGVLSNKNTAGAITQLAGALQPHRVIVHHDASQTGELRVKRDNVSLVRPSMRTAWGEWSIVAATIRLMELATESDDCDYFQLLSESCLPIRPVTDFENFLRSRTPDAMIDMLPVEIDSIDSLTEHAWRYLPRTRTLARAAHVASRWMTSGESASFSPKGGLKLRVAAPTTNRYHGIRQQLGRKLLRQFFRPPMGAFPVSIATRCWIGGEWFGISGESARRLLELHRSFPELEAHFSHCLLADEAYFQTLLAALNVERLHPGNHALFWSSGGRGPDLLQMHDFDRLMATDRFFARKFSLDPNCPLRRRVLSIRN